MNETNTMNIRRLLKTFGIQADEAVMAFFENNADLETVVIRLTLEDVTDYGADKPLEKLFLQVEGEISP